MSDKPSAANAAGCLRLSTGAVPLHKRREFIHEFLARDLVGVYIDPRAEEWDFNMEIAAHVLPGGGSVSTAVYSPFICGTREQAHLNDGRDDYWLFLSNQVSESSAEGGPIFDVPPGDLLIRDMGARCTFAQSGTVLAMQFERSRLIAMAPRLERNGLRTLPAATPGLSLLAGYASLLCEALSAEERTRRLAENHLYDLAAAVLNGGARGDTVRSADGIKCARLGLIKRDIAERLLDPGLTADTVAARQGISPQYLRALLNTENTTFTDYVRERRLSHAWDLLIDPRHIQTRICSIAYHCGFSDLSYFNRVFRRRYGMTPSEARAEARTSA